MPTARKSSKVSAAKKRKPAQARGTPKSKAKKTSCWSGFVRVPGTQPGAKGSCRKKKAA